LISDYLFTGSTGFEPCILISKYRIFRIEFQESFQSILSDSTKISSAIEMQCLVRSSQTPLTLLPSCMRAYQSDRPGTSGPRRIQSQQSRTLCTNQEPPYGTTRFSRQADTRNKYLNFMCNVPRMPLLLKDDNSCLSQSPISSLYISIVIQIQSSHNVQNQQSCLFQPMKC
jgi:hypothetical protein